MAKKSTDTEQATASTDASPSSETSRSVAARVIRCLYGCGVPESHKRVDAFDEATVEAIAQAEASKRRDRVPAIIAKAQVKKA